MATNSENPTRQAIKLALSGSRGPMSVSVLAELTDSSLANTGYHLQILERGGEVRRVTGDPHDAFEPAPSRWTIA